MKKIIALLLALTLSTALVGCGHEISIDFPFDISEVKNVEMYHYDVPANAEKKVVTGSSDIEALYTLFTGLSLKDKQSEPVTGKSVTSFRFNLSDGTSYELIYLAEAVKQGRLQSPSGNFDYFTSADIGGLWKNLSYETEAVQEDKLPSNN